MKTMRNTMKILAVILAFAMMMALSACGQSAGSAPAATEAPAETPAAETAETAEAPAEEPAVYKVGICNYVDDASLNQIVENIQQRLAEIGEEQNVVFDISYDNCNADVNVLEQIIQNFPAGTRI